MFKIKKLNIEVNHEYVAMLMEKDANQLGLKCGDRIKIFSSIKKDKSIICDLDIINGHRPKGCVLKEGEIGIFEAAYEKLGIPENKNVTIVPAPKPNSVDYVRDKFNGHRLSEKQMQEIIKDIVDNRYTDVEITYFVLACSAHPLDDDEVIGLTKAMVSVGKKLEFQTSNGIIVDKHCIGGIPGNRTTMIVVPIVAAAGLTIPKTSSRSITSPSGTADTMEVLANVELSLSKMYGAVKETNGCIAWGGSLDLSPADDIIINVEHPLDIDSEGQMIASILSKKKSAGSTHVLIDIPYGHNAKVLTKQHALRLKKRFEKVGKAIDLNIEVMLSDGSAPIGKGVGPLLEAIDVMKVLKNDLDLPQDLKEKALMMSAKLISLGEGLSYEKSYNLAKNILETGIAYEKFEEIRSFQGKKDLLPLAKHSYKIVAQNPGKVKLVDNKLVSRIAFMLGAPMDKAAGIYLHKSKGDNVEGGEVIAEIYSNSELKLKYSKAFLNENAIFHLG